MVKGFTIRGGKGTRVPAGYTQGGGILVAGGSVYLSENDISGCQADWGGGISIGGSFSTQVMLGDVEVRGNTIRGNKSSKNGGGIQVANSHTAIIDNLFESNISGFDGGGLDALYSVGSIVITGNTFRGNVAQDKGGGLRVGCTIPETCGPITIDHNVIVDNTAYGLDFGENGGGGGIAIHAGPVLVTNNTIVRNSSQSEVICSGGGILLTEGAHWSTTRLLRNIIAFNLDCGISCRWSTTAYSESNLVWMNTLGNVGTNDYRCEGYTQGGMLTQDPMFCFDSGPDVSVSSSSPALSTSSGPIGAIGVPGCAGVLTIPSTWGWIKSRLVHR
jgi:hypothetical protein